jgi:cell division control protein 6
VNISAAEKTYAIVCEEYGESPRKHTQFWTYIQDIEKLGVIRTVVLNDSGGRTTMITLPGIPSKVLSEKMEGLLEARSRDGSE